MHNKYSTPHTTPCRYSTKIEVLELLKSASDPLYLTVVAGGLGPADLGQLEAGREQSRPGGGRPLTQQTQVSQQRIGLRYEKARVFRGKVLLEQYNDIIRMIVMEIQDGLLFDGGLLEEDATADIAEALHEEQRHQEPEFCPEHSAGHTH